MTQSTLDHVFVGRKADLAALTKAMGEACSGAPRMVVVQGEPGIGKTALVRNWLHHPATRPLTLLRARCDASETDMRFGLIEQLAASVPRDVARDFPLLRHTSPEAAPFQVGTQLLRLIDELQSAGPVAVVVDDVQWADPASVQSLGFVVRRLEADSVLMLLIRRTGSYSRNGAAEELRRLVDETEWRTKLTLGGLDSDEIAQLAERLSGRTWDRIAVERLRQQTHGSPLYLQTVLSETDNLSGAAPGSIPVPRSLAAAVHQQLAGLPDPCRRLVEAAAVMDARAPLALVAAVAGVADPAAALEPLVDRCLLDWWPGEPDLPVAVRHALQRDAILAAMTPSRLRRLHAVAADAVPHEASWRHRVAAAGGASPVLAGRLEQAAAEHIRTGGHVRGGTMLKWASDVSANRVDKERRLLTAVAYAMWGDDCVRATALLPDVRQCAPSPLRSLVLGVRGMTHSTGDDDPEALLSQAMSTAEGVAGLEWVYPMAATWLGMTHIMGDCERAIPVLERVISLRNVDPGLVNRARAVVAIAVGFVEGPQAGLRKLARMAQAPRTAQPKPLSTYQLALDGLLHVWAGELERGRHDLDTALRIARENSSPAVSEFAYSCSAAASYLLGDWDRARINAEHGLTVVSMEDKPWASSFANAVASWVPSGRGEWEKADELLSAAERSVSRLSPGFPRFTLPAVGVGRAIHGQARGNHTEMLSALMPVVELPEPGMRTLMRAWWQPLYVEALIGVGDTTKAQQALADLVRMSRRIRYLRLPAAWLSGWLAETCGDLPAAIRSYRAGTRITTCTNDMPLYRGLLEHALGRALGATGHDSARTWLQAASERLHALGALPFAERCDAEPVMRQSSGPGSHRQDPFSFTDRERSIAHLVSLGCTNREIAAELFVSTKTVEYHLGKIYVRLNLKNRSHLREFMQRHAVS